MLLSSHPSEFIVKCFWVELDGAITKTSFEHNLIIFPFCRHLIWPIDILNLKNLHLTWVLEASLCFLKENRLILNHCSVRSIDSNATVAKCLADCVKQTIQYLLSLIIQVPQKTYSPNCLLTITSHKFHLYSNITDSNQLSHKSTLSSSLGFSSFLPRCMILVFLIEKYSSV